MFALATALFTATLALLGKIGFDVWGRHRERRGIAGALAGEIGAYIDLLRGPETVVRYRELATGNSEERLKIFRAMPILPAPHPVFDKVADRFGFLSALDAYGVSRIYNVVTGLRLILTGMSSQGFLDAGDEIQVARLVYIANTMERELPAARLIVDRLQRVSRQSLWCWIGGCDDRT